MKFIVKCPHCDNPFTVEENWAGQITSCPICNHQVRVPQPPPPTNDSPQHPFTAVPRASESDERHGQSFAGDACLDFFLTLFCCCWPIALVLALRTHSKMRENNNFSGVWWLYLCYFFIALQACGGLISAILQISSHSLASP